MCLHCWDGQRLFLALVLSHSDLMQRPPRAHTSGCNPCAADVACLFWQLRSNWSLRRHQTWIPPPHCPLVSPTSLCRLPSTHVPRFSLLLPHRVPSPLYAHMLSLHTSLRRHVGFFSPRHQRPSAAPLTPAFMLGPLEPFPHTAAGGTFTPWSDHSAPPICPFPALSLRPWPTRP